MSAEHIIEVQTPEQAQQHEERRMLQIDRRKDVRDKLFWMEATVRLLRCSEEYWLKTVNEDFERVKKFPVFEPLFLAGKARLHMAREILEHLNESVPQPCPCLPCQEQWRAPEVKENT